MLVVLTMTLFNQPTIWLKVSKKAPITMICVINRRNDNDKYKHRYVTTQHGLKIVLLY